MPFFNKLIFKPMELKNPTTQGTLRKRLSPLVGREFEAFGKQRIQPGGLREPFGGNKRYGTKAFG